MSYYSHDKTWIILDSNLVKMGMYIHEYHLMMLF